VNGSGGMTREVIRYQLTKKVSYKLIRKPNKLAKEPIEKLAEEARTEADRERQRANEADRRAELLSAKLRELGIDIE
jgi:hypothetical protein